MKNGLFDLKLKPCDGPKVIKSTGTSLPLQTIFEKQQSPKAISTPYDRPATIAKNYGTSFSNF